MRSPTFSQRVVQLARVRFFSLQQSTFAAIDCASIGSVHKDSYVNLQPDRGTYLRTGCALASALHKQQTRNAFRSRDDRHLAVAL
jgi:hypothetical protein